MKIYVLYTHPVFPMGNQNFPVGKLSWSAHLELRAAQEHALTYERCFGPKENSANSWGWFNDNLTMEMKRPDGTVAFSIREFEVTE